MEITHEGDGAAPWLDDEETRTWLALFALATRGLRLIEADIRRDSGLSLFEYQVLAHLSMASGRRARMSALAALAVASPARLSNVVSRLEKAGWIRREQDPEDRRGAIAVLAEEGLRVVERAAPAHARSVRTHAIDRMDAEQRAALRAIADALIEEC